MHFNRKKIALNLILILVGLLSVSASYSSIPIFKMEFLLGSSNFPSNLGLYDPPAERIVTITNQSSVNMTGMVYMLPPSFQIDQANTTCGATLNQNSSCQLAIFFAPNKLGHFAAILQTCGMNGLWCSQFANVFEIKVTQNTITSKNCNDIATRPFGKLDCQSSYIYANNFKAFMQQVIGVEAVTNSQFNYFQHIPSENETTTPCLQARQTGVPSLDPNIKGGGLPLCGLMGFATSNASENDLATTSKLYPPYLNFLLGTAYPITADTVPLAELNELQQDFNTTAMDTSVQDLGYVGYVNFLSAYYQEQLQLTYQDCGSTETCPSIYYLPYRLTSGQESLEVWPPKTNYWGSSGGGGSGAGYQIQAFKPGSSTHYTLFSGGGGGGAGNTSPEGVMAGSLPYLINTGSGGGGGSQFSDCYTVGSDNLNGLGLGAGTGGGLSTHEGSPVSFAVAPAVDYSFYPPISHPTWNNTMVLTQYSSNLTYLFQHLIPQLYNEGYTIAVSGGGGGGTGLEFLDQQGEEFQPHPLSVGYGFNFCYVFNKANKYYSTDCISSSTTTSDTGATSTDLDTLIYQNVGNFYNEGMNLAILPQNCNGYTNFTCDCTFQHAYVICQLENLLVANHYTAKDIPTWLINPHCSETQEGLETIGHIIDQYLQSANHYTSTCQTAINAYFQAKSQTSCVVPWANG